ncbi:MAG: 4Fe-4S ferredoxin [Syntrophus sp. (in: bacteria)]|nr:4Fe-4S ferredoxin [Syntrophus sp. (in: bacteria)]
MNDKTNATRVWLTFFTLVIAVVLLSFGASGLWQGKSEKTEDAAPLVFRDGMTIADFGRANELSNAFLQKAFQLQSKEDTERKLDELNLSRTEIAERINRSRTLEAEYESKNWVKIPLKFALWLLFLSTVFLLMRRKKITPERRKTLYLTAIMLFGILLGSDPSPMGTVKDAIALYGAKGVIFPPRMIALTVFLILVFLANKFICSWGCQLGTLQDLIFRLNRNNQDTKGILRQYHPPFLWSNAIRIAFFLIFTLAAFAWATDLIDPIDPFKIYKPAAISIGGGISLALILIAALFVYRPWCQFFCPFGLVGWFLEKVSLFKIIVNYETCIGCRSCEKACPSTVMGAILKRDRTIPDCFACGTCIGVCPTDSIRLAAGKRSRPPKGKFRTAEGADS